MFYLQKLELVNVQSKRILGNLVSFIFNSSTCETETNGKDISSKKVNIMKRKRSICSDFEKVRF